LQLQKPTEKKAESSIQLILSTVTRKRDQEENKSGLMIVEARYGNLAKQEAEEAKTFVQDGDNVYPYVIDVTIPVQYFVEESQLHLSSTPKSNLLGFYDPCIGELKRLYIRYLFKDKLHEAVFDDSEPLSLPHASHQIDE